MVVVIVAFATPFLLIHEGVMCHMHGGKGLGQHGPILVGFHILVLLTTAHSIVSIIEKTNVFN